MNFPNYPIKYPYKLFWYINVGFNMINKCYKISGDDNEYTENR